MRKSALTVTILCLACSVSLISGIKDRMSNVSQVSTSSIMLKKIGEIKGPFNKSEASYLWNAVDIAIDNKGALYVADAGWNRIFKFSIKGEFVLSFGNEGQGPGELLAGNVNTLYLSYGNDHCVYVYDQGNTRISVFGEDGKYIRSFRYNTLDRPQVNSRGEIYLLSSSGDYLVDIFDSTDTLKGKIVPSSLHYTYPLVKPPRGMKSQLTCHQFIKIITQENHLIGLSNISFRIFHYDEQNTLLGNFEIKDKVILADLRNRLNIIVKKGGFINPFTMFIDPDNNLFIGYYYNNSLRKGWSFNEYRVTGDFVKTIVFPDDISPVVLTNGSGIFYAISLDRTSVGIYSIN